MRYFEQPPPSGNGLCSYPPCPCDEVTIPRGQGYLYITEECVEFRRDALSLDDAATKLKEMGDRTDSMIIPGSGVASPILVCEEGAKLLELDLEIATADARRWWETGEVPLRPTPRKKPSPAAVAGSRCLTGHTERVMGVAISQNGTHALSCGWDSTVRLWNVQTANELYRFTGHVGFVAAVAFAPDGRRGISGGADQTVRVWDVESGREIHRMTGHSFTIFSLTFSPDGQLALSGSGDKTVRLWDMERGIQIRRFGGFFLGKDSWPVDAVAFSPDGRWALSGGMMDRTMRLWNVETGKEIRRFVGHTSPVRSLAFFPDGHRLLSATPYDPGVLYLFDFESGRHLGRFEGHTKSVNSLALSADGHWAISGSDDWTVRLWQLKEE